MVSCCSHVDIMVAMAVPGKRPGEVVSTSGRLIVMQDVSLPYKDLAILVNPSSHICFCAVELPQGVFAHCMKIFGALVCWLEIVGGEAVTIAGMVRHLKGMVEMEPWGQAVWHLLLHSLLDSGASSSTTLEHWGGVTITQGDGGSLERTCSSMNVVNGLMHLLNSLTYSVNWCGSPSCGGWTTSAQCCRAFV